MFETEAVLEWLVESEIITDEEADAIFDDLNESALDEAQFPLGDEYVEPLTGWYLGGWHLGDPLNPFFDFTD